MFIVPNGPELPSAPLQCAALQDAITDVRLKLGDTVT